MTQTSARYLNIHTTVLLLFFFFVFAPRKALYRYCGERGIPHRRCGKLVVASSAAQLPALRGLRGRAEACGVTDVRLIEAQEAREMEPHVVCNQVKKTGRGGGGALPLPLSRCLPLSLPAFLRLCPLFLFACLRQYVSYFIYI